MIEDVWGYIYQVVCSGKGKNNDMSIDLVAKKAFDIRDSWPVSVQTHIEV